MTVILMMWRIGLRIKDFMPWSLVRCSHWLRVEKMPMLGGGKFDRPRHDCFLYYYEGNFILVFDDDFFPINLFFNNNRRHVIIVLQVIKTFNGWMIQY